MKLRRSAPALIMGTAIAVIAAIALSSNYMFAQQMSAIEVGQFDLMRAIVEFNLQGGQDRALARAEMLASSPEVRDAFAARDRERLLASTQALYQIQHEKYGADQLQFVGADNVSFLRVQKPEAFGDDLSSFRPIVVSVNQQRNVQKGISLSRSGPALMGVVPMFDAQGQHSGLVEMGLDFGPILDKLKAAYGFDCTFFVKEEPLRRISTGVDPSVLDEHNRVGEYLKFHSTNWGLMKGLVDADDLAKVDGEPIQYTRDSVGMAYGVVMVSLHNAAGDPIGIIAAARDFSGTRGAAGRAAVNQGAAALFALILLAGAVLIAIRGFLLRPVAALGEAMDALAQGNATLPLDASGYCEELEAAAASYETLRRKLAGKDGAA